MADGSNDDFCKDCDPTLAAFLEKIASHNKQQIELNAKVTCPTCGRIHEYRFPNATKADIPPNSVP